MIVKPVHSPRFTAIAILGVCIARQLNMEAVEPLSGFEVEDNNMFSRPHSQPPNEKGRGKHFFTYMKKFLFIFRFISFRIQNCPLTQNFVPSLMKQLLSELKTSDLNVDFLLYFRFPRTITTMRDFSSSIDISIPNFKQEYIQLSLYMNVFGMFISNSPFSNSTKL